MTEQMRQLGRRVIWTIVVILAAIGVAHVYLMSRALRDQGHMVPSGGLTTLGAFPVLEGGIRNLRLGPLQMNLQRLNRSMDLAEAETFLRFREEGWRRVDMPENPHSGRIYSKGTETKMLLLKAIGPEQTLLAECCIATNGFNDWKLAQNQNNVEFPAQELSGLPKPSGSRRLISASLGAGLGVAAYEVPVVGDSMVAYAAELETRGWVKNIPLSGLSDGIMLFSKNGVSSWVSSTTKGSNRVITVMRYEEERR